MKNTGEMQREMYPSAAKLNIGFSPTGNGFESVPGGKSGAACGCSGANVCFCGNSAGGPESVAFAGSRRPNLGKIAYLANEMHQDANTIKTTYPLYDYMGARLIGDFMRRGAQAGYDPKTLAFAANRLYAEQQYTRRLGQDALRLADSALVDVRHNLLAPRTGYYGGYTPRF